MNETVPMDNNRPPERDWYPTHIGPDGQKLWGSREWNPAERAEYVRTVLVKRPPG
jgi:hypothetical protein